MAREDLSERGLPSAEIRRQILKRAGTILDEARDLLALLDRYEAEYPRSQRENEEVLERAASSERPYSLQASTQDSVSTLSSPPGHALAA